YEPSNCISCGRCAKACPMKLMPMFIDFNVLAGKLDEAAKYGAMDCIECGSCSFVCPAKRPLVANIKRAKLMLKEKK
ncbi:MAG: 4Fe-4S dicluster domain-containing protein, partial [Clostridia bacterium]